MMKILIATDGSACAQKAADLLAALPISNPHVTVVTVSFNIESVNVSNVQPWVPEWREIEEQRVSSHHEEIKRKLAGFTDSIETLHRHGSPTYWILEEASKLEADLIVVGSLGHSAIGRLLLGSVSDEIATNAKCSVLVVRPDMDAEREPQIQRIVVGYDGSPGSEDAVNELLQYSWSPETTVEIISVNTPIHYYGEGYSQNFIELEARESEQMRAAGEQLVKRIKSRFPNATAEVKRGEHIGNTIVQTAEQNKADLIVTGDTGHGLLRRWLMGSTAKYVLHHAPCSVWLSRYHRKDNNDKATKEDHTQTSTAPAT